MAIGTDSDGTDDNDGPHCRNCHVGASNCDVCHSDDSATNFSAAYTATITASVSGKTNYSSQAFLRQSAVASTAVGAKCLDGGFSFPHRTLGANMLKDELYGVDFDGSPRPFGSTRTAAASLTATQGTGTFSIDTGEWVYWTGETRNATSIIPSVRNDSGVLLGAAVENLDSVCIDCHGDATYWNGDNPAYSKTFSPSGSYGVYGSTQYNGTSLTAWELLLKGLP
ncbi:MAG: hypothetical protein QMD96_04430 [Anaerosomatales bacterium]|nr:hypothetical protein [Anaerosomatales bacterium]